MLKTYRLRRKGDQTRNKIFFRHFDQKLNYLELTCHCSTNLSTAWSLLALQVFMSVVSLLQIKTGIMLASSFPACESLPMERNVCHQDMIS